mmetsp:Transcript_17315/g.41372  ORF Transcript_17315/g.41372 Transcript_17315/m.41372 type:complete len:119 (-) Transcript_17315:1744-2100(-)
MNAPDLREEPVRLNVYDLTDSNKYVYWCGFGAFHTGVEVYGIEYAYGGHPYDMSGLFATEPRNPPGNVRFRESIEIGTTLLSPGKVQEVICRLGEEYTGKRSDTRFVVRAFRSDPRVK